MPERRYREASIFLRMTAIEMRRLAERAPEIAAELRYIAGQLDAAAQSEAEALIRRDREPPDD